MPRKPRTPSAPDYSAPALTKGLDILEALAETREPLLLSVLARKLGRATHGAIAISSLQPQGAPYKPDRFFPALRECTRRIELELAGREN